MLRRFAVENFMGFKDRAVLDLSARDYPFNGGLVRGSTVGKGLVFGRNGAGKSNLGLALLDIANVLTDNHKGPLLEIPHYLNLGSGNPTARFEYEFLLGGMVVVYRYGKAGPNDLVYEQLAVDGETVLSFDIRKGPGSLTSRIAAGHLAGLAPYLRLLEAGAPSYNLSILKHIHRSALWPEGHPMSLLFGFADHMLLLRGPGGDDSFAGLLCAPPDIDGTIIGSGRTRDFQRFLEACGAGLDLEEGLLNGRRILLARSNGRLASLESLMSSGTAQLRFFYGWSLLLSGASFIYLDGLDAFCHEEAAALLFKELARLQGPQALLATHNTLLMSNSVSRPDVCFLLDGGRIRSLAGLTGKEIREAHNVEKMYRNGAFDNR